VPLRPAPLQLPQARRGLLLRVPGAPADVPRARAQLDVCARAPQAPVQGVPGLGHLRAPEPPQRVPGVRARRLPVEEGAERHHSGVQDEGCRQDAGFFSNFNKIYE